MKILQEFSILFDIAQISDVIPTQHNFGVPFNVVIPDRKDWKNSSPKDYKALVYYTDGSKMDNSAGIGVYGPAFNYYKALGSSPSIFQAEIYAIEVCARRCLNRRDVGRRKVYIMSDSQAALRALKSNAVDSKLVLDCINVLKCLSLKMKVTLMWIPGHSGHHGNEKADELARKGAQTRFIGPEPFFGYGPCKLREEIRIRETQIKFRHWENLPEKSHSKRFIEYNSKRTENVLTLNKSDLRTLTGLLTGHCTLRDHMKKIGISQDDTCRLCMEESETAEHLLCECEAASNKRIKFFLYGFVSPEQVKNTSPYVILSFFKSLNLGEL